MVCGGVWCTCRPDGSSQSTTQQDSMAAVCVSHQRPLMASSRLCYLISFFTSAKPEGPICLNNIWPRLDYSYIVFLYFSQDRLSHLWLHATYVLLYSPHRSSYSDLIWYRISSAIKLIQISYSSVSFIPDWIKKLTNCYLIAYFWFQFFLVNFFKF